MDDSKKLLCPSYVCKPGAQLFGIVNSSGFIDYLNSTIEVTEAFETETRKGRAPEKRFRFAGNCAKNGCNQWSKDKSQCGLIDTVVEVIDNPKSQKLQECAIRTKCRWFAQKKEIACYNCNELIRNIEIKMLSD